MTPTQLSVVMEGPGLPEGDWIGSALGPAALHLGGLLSPVRVKALQAQLAQLLAGTGAEPRWLLAGALTPPRLLELVALARKRTPQYRPAAFFNWFEVRVPPAAATEVARRLDKSARVRSWSPFPTLSPVAEGDDQLYRDTAPTGVGVVKLSGVAGADGATVRLVDVEAGWQDVPPTAAPNDREFKGVSFTSWGSNTSDPHGTKVLGVILSRADGDPAAGNCVGIAPGVQQVHLVGTTKGPANVIYDAAAQALDQVANRAGDVVLFEVGLSWLCKEGTKASTVTSLPAEADPKVAELIRLAVAAGIVVVEAAGNAGKDLSSLLLYPATGKGGLGSPSKRLAKDTGAILVGAAAQDVGTGTWLKRDISNHGSRVLVWGPGEKVWTVDPNAAGGYGNFDGTSAAAAVVAGCTLSIQGMCDAGGKARKSPSEMRNLLAGTGTEVLVVAGGSKAGVIPDLAKIQASL